MQKWHIETKEIKEFSFVFQCLNLNYTCTQTHTIICEKSKHKRTSKVPVWFGEIFQAYNTEGKCVYKSSIPYVNFNYQWNSNWNTYKRENTTFNQNSSYN